MDINKVLEEYDSMFGRYELTKIEEFLTGKLKEAYEQQAYFPALTLTNELMGFCRDTHQTDKGVHYCKETLLLLERLGLKGTVEYATSLLNVANAYRAFELHEDSGKLYEEVEAAYFEKLPKGAFHYASLYNNWSLLCQEMSLFEDAKEKLLLAMEVVDGYPEAIIEQATTRTNLGVTLLQLRESEVAKRYLQEAMNIFEQDGGQNFHYSGALAAMGDVCYAESQYHQAVMYYEKAMLKLERQVGKTQAYLRVEEKYNTAKQMCQDNLTNCRKFYEQYGKPMIQEKFPDYADRIAVGLVGEGSDCFGFDDAISMDHDYGIGFCMWVTKADYDQIGHDLEQAYKELVDKYYANPMTDTMMQASYQPFFHKRRGVFVIEAFYQNLLGGFWRMESGKILPDCWSLISDDKWATAVNGQVFRDDLGVFTGIRSAILDYYPEPLRRQKIAQCLHEYAQYAQSNYGRMMARKDLVTAGICVAKAMECAMDLAYLLDKQFAPYYKWKYKGLAKLAFGKTIRPYLDELAECKPTLMAWESVEYDATKVNTKDKILVLFEQLAECIVEELCRQNLVTNKGTFLENYCQDVLHAVERQLKSEYMIKENGTMENIGGAIPEESLVDQIVELEWKQFDKVKNEGGRADCQDDWNTFSIMRKSQYLAWSEDLLISYLRDLKEAEAKGWNLIMEKYARMMKSTAPARYAELEKDLPVRTPERIAIQEEIIKLQVNWMEEFAKQYPKMAGNARSIHTHEDTPFNTSYETYLRGELGTYSEETLIRYGRFVVALQQAGKNLAYEIMNHTAKLYGYQNVEDAESRLE